MNLQQRIDLLGELKKYISSDDPIWQAIQEEAFRQNSWFTPEFITLAIENIAGQFLATEKLTAWAAQYGVADEPPAPRKVGVVMAGNIPLVGFHDFLSVFLSGHPQRIKPSSKDEVLIRHLVEQLVQWEPAAAAYCSFANMLPGCDAYIATGSDNSARYFDYYFGRFPHIIRRNRTSVAVLSGAETSGQLEKLADDVYRYFGLGCRNVTKLYVPPEYDFRPLLETFKKYDHLIEHHKYKNNYDYQLAVLILNKRFYMTNGSLLLSENGAVFSPIGQLHYEYYNDAPRLFSSLDANQQVQCVVGDQHIGFGEAQKPGLTDYADGADTLQFLLSL